MIKAWCIVCRQTLEINKKDWELCYICENCDTPRFAYIGDNAKERCEVCNKLDFCDRHYPGVNGFINYRGREFCFDCFGSLPIDFWYKFDAILNDNKKDIVERCSIADKLINYWVVTGKVFNCDI